MKVNSNKTLKAKFVAYREKGKEKAAHLILIKGRHVDLNREGFSLYIVEDLNNWNIEKEEPICGPFIFQSEEQALFLGELLLTTGGLARIRKKPAPLKGGKKNIISNGKLTEEYLDARINELIDRFLPLKVKLHNRKLIKSMMGPQCAHFNAPFLKYIKHYLEIDDKKKYVRVAHCLYHYEILVEHYEALLKGYADARILVEMIAYVWFHIISELIESVAVLKDQPSLTLLKQLRKDMRKVTLRVPKPFSKKDLETIAMNN